MKKRLAVLLAAAMTMSVATPVMAEEEVVVSLFNTKSEIQSLMEEKAAEYSEATEGVTVEVYFSNDTVAAHMATKYAAEDPYVLAMVDAKDIYSLGAEHAVDLSEEAWVAETTQAIAIDGKTYGFPFCVEARGIIYNADAIEAITGTEFVPADYATLDAFQGLIDTLIAGGMEAPVGIMKEDWSLGAHYLCQVFEMQEDAEAKVQAMYAGEGDLANDVVFNSLMDTFDVLKANNYAKDSAIAAEREVTEQKLAEGEIAFMFGGNWDWAVINAYDYTENMGIMPVPQNTESTANTMLVGGGSKYFMIDNTKSEAEIQAAKDFLNWLVFDEAGQDFVVNTCALVPAYANITLPVADPLGASVKAYADAGLMIPNYNYMPDDHYAVCGASFQKYLADQIDRAGFVSEIEGYWTATTPVAH